ncbi:MAG: hypothetical protein A2V78_07830 [Betaproteobacteria bacterium RBG_16_64_18]|nr:MAG: hypothetical protein A2V78_07830 [Betaproteobacteria bacterium RBG_16_64_18]
MALITVSLFVVSGVIHYQTPMLAAMSAEFGADAAAVGWVATLTFGGFLAGLIFLAPLGDRLDKRKLVLGQLAVLIPALLAMAAAPSLATLAAASFVVGASGTFGQHFIAMSAELARPDERGRTMGTLLTALFLGVLFGRITGGLVASYIGWRWMYAIVAVMMLVLTPALLRRLPSMPAKTQMGYRPLMWSIVRLVGRHAELRRVAANQLLLGVSYGGFWATVAPMLALFHHLGPAQAGLMGIPGAAGIFVARACGRWTDRRGVMPVVTTGIGVVLVAFVVLGFASLWIGAAIAGAILLDCGLRAAIVANQTLVNTIASDARSRFNTVFSASVWGGNAVGALLASTALAHAGWLAVCTIAVTASCLALAMQLSAGPHPR